MELVLDLIKNKKLFKPGSVIGVGVSGDLASMALLNFLNNNREELDIDIVAININFDARRDEAESFVANYCKENHIRFYKFKLDAEKLAKNKGKKVEEVYKDSKYEFFNSLKSRQVLDYIALANQTKDVAEKFLYNIIKGKKLHAIDDYIYLKDDFFVNPFLEIPREKIVQYVYENDIPYLEDIEVGSSDFDKVMHEFLTKLRKVVPNLDDNIVDFCNNCRADDVEIRKNLDFSAVLEGKDFVKIPLTYFVYSRAVLSRLLDEVCTKLGMQQGITGKDLEIIINTTQSSEVGVKSVLCNGLIVFKEYEYLVVVKKSNKQKMELSYDFKIGTTRFSDYGKIFVKRIKDASIEVGGLVVDLDLLPKGVVWRKPKSGDYIHKFGSGVRKLRAYLVDRKVPNSLINNLPVLAKENEVFCIAGVDIADAIGVTENSKNLVSIKYEQQNWA